MSAGSSTRLLVLCASLHACTGSSREAAPNQTLPTNSGNVELVSIEYGRLVDVYGFERTGNGLSLTLYRSDVVIGPEIADERPSDSALDDSDVDFDFLAVDPNTLTPRLLIPRTIGTDAFDELFDRLDDGLAKVTKAKFGQDATTMPIPAVPRNAALLLTFSEALGVDEDFFVTRDESGAVTGVRNTEAIQLLEITGDPSDDNDEGDFRAISTRVVPRGTRVVLDPVFLGNEGTIYGTRNNASGMPAAFDQLSANVRIAIALDGPLSIPGIHIDADSTFQGKNHDGYESVIRDFRTGHADDDSPAISRGFLRDSEPPRLVGALPFVLQSVAERDDASLIATVFKNGRSHDIDRGDVIQFTDISTGLTSLTEVIEEPVEDEARPAEQHVQVPVRRVEGLTALDPRRLSGYPEDPTSDEGRAWLRQNAPRAVLIAEFTGSRTASDGREYGDDPANFVTFTPEPRPQIPGYDPFPDEPSLPNVHVSPFAAAVVRFSKPVDLSTVSAFDTLLFATKDVFDVEQRDAFAISRGISPNELSLDKYMTPHLVDARVFDENGSQTTMRLQPVLGFYLDESMRLPPPPDFIDIEVTPGDPISGEAATPHGQDGGTVDPELRRMLASQLPYFVEIVAGASGIRDLSGNPLDIRNSARDHVAVPFYLDGRKDANELPHFGDNLVVSIIRRYGSLDEDEQPSIYRHGEPGESRLAIPDTFGGVTYTSDGKLASRPASRLTRIVDDKNQSPPPPQSSVFRWCPEEFLGQGTVASNSATTAFGLGIQNPFNPFGSRVQTLWREIDMGLSRDDPLDFNLDVERLYWAPLTSASIFFDIFDSVSLYLGHSEYRPEPCVGGGNALPRFTLSGLKDSFELNYANDRLTTANGTIVDTDRTPEPHAAYENVSFAMNSEDAILEPTGNNRFLPLPEFRKPYFVWRDETLTVQGGMTTRGIDWSDDDPVYEPYILSPFLNGRCEPTTEVEGGATINTIGVWDNRRNYHFGSQNLDNFTGGLLGAIALPLLADFQTLCDSPDLPAEWGFVAQGYNGWQVALSVQSNIRPNFRVFSGGDREGDECIGPTTSDWTTASGQLNSEDGRTGDNSVYWIMADFLKRQTVATNGFVEILNPHRMPPEGAGNYDPRLGPFDRAQLPNGALPNFEWHFDPPLVQLPAGTRITPEFRAASRVTGGVWNDPTAIGAGSAPGVPNPCFALNPRCAGDAQLRKYDVRGFPTVFDGARNWWSYLYTEHVTDYSTEVDDLTDTGFLSRYSGPNANDRLTPLDVVYFNWRFIIVSNVEATPTISPSTDAFAISYRFESND